MELRDFPVPDAEDGTRLDRFIRRRHAGINQGRIEKLLRSGSVRVDGAKAKSSTRLAGGQVVTMPSTLNLPPSAPKPEEKAPPDPAVVETLRNAVIARGDGWIAINKPSGLASQGGTGTREHVDGALAAAFPGDGPPRLVHRLDRDTSGVMVVATNLAATRRLARGFRAPRAGRARAGKGKPGEKTHQKTYLALVLGVPSPKEGTVDAPLRKAGGRGVERMVVDGGGLASRTAYTVLEAMGGAASLVALRPETGRTHQLRAHMAHLGCPVLGDRKYGGAAAFPNGSVTRLCLHAAHLALEGGEAITAPMPQDLAPALDFFGIDPGAAMERAANPDLFAGAA